MTAKEERTSIHRGWETAANLLSDNLYCLSVWLSRAAKCEGK